MSALKPEQVVVLVRALGLIAAGQFPTIWEAALAARAALKEAGVES